MRATQFALQLLQFPLPSPLAPRLRSAAAMGAVVLVTALGAQGCGDPDVADGSTDAAVSLDTKASADDSTVTAADSGQAVEDVFAADSTTGQPDSAVEQTDGATLIIKECSDHSDCQPANFCLGQGVCKKGPNAWVCALLPGTAVVCDTAGDTACEASACNPSTGECNKVNAANGTPCTDADPCVVQSSCSGGKCSPGPASWCQCAKNADCDDLTGKNPCLGTWFCDLATFPHACKLNDSQAVVCDPSLSTPCQLHACDPKSGACALLPD